MMEGLCAKRGASTPQAVRLPAELLERIDRYAARLEAELHLSVSRSDALRRLPTLALDDAEDTADAEAILRANEPRLSWEELKASLAPRPEAQGSLPTGLNS
jgi:antitoxin component of MazEF toxin-antitoxin module